MRRMHVCADGDCISFFRAWVNHRVLSAPRAPSDHAIARCQSLYYRPLGSTGLALSRGVVEHTTAWLTNHRVVRYYGVVRGVAGGPATRDVRWPVRGVGEGVAGEGSEVWGPLLCPVEQGNCEQPYGP